MKRVANTPGFRALSGCSKGCSKVPEGDATIARARNFEPGRYIRLLSIIPYYVPRALVAIFSFRTTRSRGIFSLRFFPSPSLSLPPLFIIAPVSHALDRHRSISRCFTVGMNNRADRGDKSRRELFAKRARSFFFSHTYRGLARLARVSHLSDRSSLVQTASLISILSIRLAHCLFVKLRRASCNVRFANE